MTSRRTSILRAAFASSLAVLSAVSSQADTANIAVASNFAAVAAELERLFETAGPHRISVVAGSTGKLYAQILNGAPFAVFLSADELRPRLLEEQGQSAPGSRFTYAVGRLALWSRHRFPEGRTLADILTDAAVRRIAIPNPELAPFGLAAQEALAQLGIADQVSGKLVFAENVGQAFAFVVTKNADAGFVSMSNISALPPGDPGFVEPVPASLHRPIRQDAVLLAAAADNEAARSFHEFLKGGKARSVIAAYGYSLASE